ncbi:MAG: dTMP kinase [SAR86 cluster bacterium]|uniref:Thymidylate kinase n=1 Tax=SAR86 cluster bacterium TaxID=2030880 RepID=A0A937IGP1_9GAMM|nr:dTMP kinase [SAR86 cluster bacterium]
MFISFEGIEGSGKSTQIKLLREFLNQEGLSPVVIREPGGTQIGEKVRDIFLTKTDEHFDPLTEVLLLYASRKQLDTNVIKPALKDGKIVIADRFADATVAYQAYGKDVSKDFIAQLHSDLEISNPDLTFFIDISPELSKARISDRESDRMESESTEFFSKVRSGYQACANNSEKVITIEGTDTIENIFLKIKEAVTKKLNVSME